MKPPNPRNSQTQALSLLLVNTALLPCWILTHLCRSSHPPTLLDMSYSHSAVPQLTQNWWEVINVTGICFLAPTKGSCFLHIGINRARKFLFPCNLLYAARSEGSVKWRMEQAGHMEILAGPSGLAHPSPVGRLVSPLCLGVPLSDSKEQKESHCDN